MRVIFPDGGEHRGTTPCSAPGCTSTTREGKPFCPNHVELAPYPASIIRELERRDVEADRLDRGLSIGQDAHLVREARLFLRFKCYTGKSFARALDITWEAAEKLIRLMGRWKMAKFGSTERGDLMVSGVADPDLPLELGP